VHCESIGASDRLGLGVLREASERLMPQQRELTLVKLGFSAVNGMTHCQMSFGPSQNRGSDARAS